MGKVLCLLLIFLSLKGAPVGNSSSPQIVKTGFFIPEESWVSLRAGYEGDFVADARANQYDQGSGRVDTYQQWTNSGTITFNLADRIEAYGVLGSCETKADWRFQNDSLSTVTRIKIESNSHFLWGAGGRAILYKGIFGAMALGGRYTEWRAKPAWVRSNGTMEPVLNANIFWKEWQVNLDFSYKIDWFIPYIGFKYLDARAFLTDFSIPISRSGSSNSFKNRDPIGLYLGCTMSSGKYFMLNFEGRVIDEEAITVSADFRF